MSTDVRSFSVVFYAPGVYEVSKRKVEVETSMVVNEQGWILEDLLVEGDTVTLDLTDGLGGRSGWSKQRAEEDARYLAETICNKLNLAAPENIGWGDVIY